jgi:leucyl aminopeptidase
MAAGFQERSMHDESFQNRLAAFAEEARERAERLPPGPEKDDLLRKVRQADIAAHVDDWANSPGLQPPK